MTEQQQKHRKQSRQHQLHLEPDPNPKRRLLMKSASQTANGIGQQREGKAIPDDESGMQVEDKLEIDNEQRTEPPGVSRTNTRRKTAMKSELRAVTTQEAVDGYREKAMIIESVEQIDELGSIMEVSMTGQVLRWARQSNLSAQSGWMEHEEPQSSDSRQALAREHSEKVKNVQCGAERDVLDCQRSDWRENAQLSWC